MNNFHHRPSESGNILIYILGAIFLIGALTLMVKGSSTPGAGIDEEALIIKVSEVQQYGQELEQAITYIFQNGHSESDIRFAHPDADSAYGVITDIPTRQVFHRDGGGATYRDPPSGIQTTVTPWHFSGANSVAQIGSSCSADDCSDLVAVLQNVTEAFCLNINEKNNIENPSNAPPQDDGNMHFSTPFSGSMTWSAHIGDSGFQANGKLEGCLEGESTPPSGTYHYYRVLLAR